jgi:ribosome production factor 1
MDNKIVITTTKNPINKETINLCEELEKIIPHSIFIKRGEEIPKSKILIKIHEERGNLIYMRIMKDDDELKFGIIEYKSLKVLRLKGRIIQGYPELVVSNMDTEAGSKVVEWFMEIFPHKRYSGRQVVSFVCYNDYIFFRMHRYIFRDGEKADFQEIGPHLTLRLKKIVENGVCESFKY